MLTLRNSMVLAVHLGCGKVEVKTYCLPVVDTINDAANYLEPDAAVYVESCQLAKNFGTLSFRHCFQEASGVTDCLAKLAIRSRLSKVWDDAMLDFISSAIAND